MEGLLNFALPFIDNSTFDLADVVDYESCIGPPADVQVPTTLVPSMDGADMYIRDSEIATVLAGHRPQDSFTTSSDTSSLQKPDNSENKSVGSPSVSSSQSGGIARSEESLWSEQSFHGKAPHVSASTIMVCLSSQCSRTFLTWTTQVVLWSGWVYHT